MIVSFLLESGVAGALLGWAMLKIVDAALSDRSGDPGERPPPAPCPEEPEWRRAAELLGLDFTRVWSGHGEISGWRQGVRIHVKATPRSLARGGGVDTEIVIARGEDLLAKTLSIHPRRADPLRSELIAGIVPTGDLDLDAAVRISGTSALVLATMTDEARRAARALVDAGATLDHGEVRAHRAGIVDAASLVAWIADLEQIQRRLPAVPRGDLARALATNAASSAEPSVAIQCLKELVTTYPATSVTTEALSRSLASAHPPVRLFAANHVAAEAAAPVLEALLDPKAIGPELRIQALTRLGDLMASNHVPGTRAIVRALADPDVRVQCLAIGLATEHPDPSFVEILVGMTGTQSRELACPLPAALAVSAGPRAEVGLILLLSSPVVEARGLAARELGAVGTTAAVAPLLESAAWSDTPTRAKEAMRAAVAQIQSRVAGAEHGQLALAESPVAVGALSLSSNSAEATEASAPGDSGRERIRPA